MYFTPAMHKHLFSVRTLKFLLFTHACFLYDAFFKWLLEFVSLEVWARSAVNIITFYYVLEIFFYKKIMVSIFLFYGFSGMEVENLRIWDENCFGFEMECSEIILIIKNIYERLKLNFLYFNLKNPLIPKINDFDFGKN